MRPIDDPRRRVGSLPGESPGPGARAYQRSTPAQEIADQLNDQAGAHWSSFVAAHREGTHFVAQGDAVLMRVGAAPTAESAGLASWIRAQFEGVNLRVERSPAYLGQRVQELRGIVLTIGPDVYGVVPVPGGMVEVRSQIPLHPSAEREIAERLQDGGDPPLPVRFVVRAAR